GHRWTGRRCIVKPPSKAERRPQQARKPFYLDDPRIPFPEVGTASPCPFCRQGLVLVVFEGGHGDIRRTAFCRCDECHSQSPKVASLTTDDKQLGMDAAGCWNDRRQKGGAA